MSNPVIRSERRRESVQSISPSKVVHQQPSEKAQAESASLQDVEIHQARGHLDECVICLQPIQDRAVAWPCNHLSFDFICLASWVQEHPQCPLCKTELSEIQYEFRGPNDYKTYHIPPPSLKSGTGSQSTTSGTSYTGQFRSRHYLNRFRNRNQAFRRPGNAPPNTTSPDIALQRRRYIYRQQLYSLHVGSNRLSRFQEFTPQDFTRSADLQARARKWIRRELQVFDFLSPDAGPTATSVAGRRRADNAEFLLMYIVAILKTVDIKGSSGKAEDMLSAYLGEDNARVFLHELTAWLRSPYTSVEDWDRHVQYRQPLPGFGELGKSANRDASAAGVSGSGAASSVNTPVSRFTNPATCRQNARRIYDPD